MRYQHEASLTLCRGLGKTLQAIALLWTLLKQGYALALVSHTNLLQATWRPRSHQGHHSHTEWAGG